MRRLCLVAAVLTLAGCASSGVMLNERQVSQFKRGEATEAQIVAALGAPTTTTEANGQRTIVYSGAQVQARPASFIPFVGAFVGGSDARATSVAFRFGPDGKLADVVSSQYANGVGVGFAAGTPISQVAAQPRKPEETPLPATAPPVAERPEIAAPAPQEERLRELKRLYDGGLISQEIYLERQRKILDAASPDAGSPYVLPDPR